MYIIYIVIEYFIHMAHCEVCNSAVRLLHPQSPNSLYNEQRNGTDSVKEKRACNYIFDSFQHVYIDVKHFT